MKRNEVKSYFHACHEDLLKNKDYATLFYAYCDAFNAKILSTNQIWEETGETAPDGGKIGTLKDNPVFEAKFKEAEETFFAFIADYMKKNKKEDICASCHKEIGKVTILMRGKKHCSLKCLKEQDGE